MNTVGGMTRTEFEGFIGHPLLDWQWKVLYQLLGDPSPGSAVDSIFPPREPL